jgi:SAM-dependent methyltransferase
LIVSSSKTNNSAEKSFDFASPIEWDKFYQEKNQQGEGDNTNKKTTMNIVEWHDSIDLKDIATSIASQRHSSCLLVGCGTSRLPEVLLEKCEKLNHLVLLDTSQTCLDLLEDWLSSTSSTKEETTTSAEAVTKRNIHYVCGDATKLGKYFCHKDNDSNDPSRSSISLPTQFDVIIDKGLTDALLCSEGWDGLLQQMFNEVSKVLSQGGQYLLISYQLPLSTKQFLIDTGNEIGLQWEFGIDLSSGADKQESSRNNDNNNSRRVSVAKATRTANVKE